MRIKKIKLNNYRQYNSIEFKFDLKGKYDLHYFIAENGIGKTTFFNSVNWCLYGDEPHLSIKDKAFSLMNKEASRSLNVGDIGTVSVEVTVESKRGDIIFLRESNFRKTEEGDLVERSQKRQVTTCFVGEDSKIFEDEEADSIVNHFVPKKIRSFFFFDAEQLKDYFDSQTSENVQKAVYDLSQIEVLSTMKSNLKTLETEYRRKASRSNPDLDDKNKELDMLEEQIKQIKKEIETYKNNISIASQEIEECNRILDGEDDIEELEARRVELNTLIPEEERRETECKKNLKDFIKRYTILLYTYPKATKLLERLNEMEKNNELPPKIDPSFLKLMLNEHTCLVCDRPLDGKGMISIENMIRKHDITTESLFALNRTKGSLEAIVEETKKYLQKKEILLNELDRLNKSIRDLVEEKRVIDLKYEAFPDVNKIKMYSKIRNENEILLTDNKVNLQIAQKQKEELIKKYDKLNDEIKLELAKRGKHDIAVSCRDIVDNASNIISQLMNNMQIEVRDHISNEMERIFLSLIWKKKTYSKVLLTDSYEVSVLDSDGQEGIGSTSGAEGQLLALSFVLALHNVSGFDSPLIIDTPVARTSGVLRKNFCEALRSVSETKQVILFFTEDEFNSRVQDALEKYSSNKFGLKLIEEKYVEKRCL